MLFWEIFIWISRSWVVRCPLLKNKTCLLNLVHPHPSSRTLRFYSTLLRLSIKSFARVHFAKSSLITFKHSSIFSLFGNYLLAMPTLLSRNKKHYWFSSWSVHFNNPNIFRKSIPGTIWKHSPSNNKNATIESWPMGSFLISGHFGHALLLLWLGWGEGRKKNRKVWSGVPPRTAQIPNKLSNRKITQR